MTDGDATATVLAIATSSFVSGSSDGDAHGGQTPWMRVQYTFATTGSHTLTFGIENAPDDIYNSALAVAAVTVTG